MLYKGNLVKPIHKGSKDVNNINIERPKIDLRSKAHVKMTNRFTGITKV